MKLRFASDVAATHAQPHTAFSATACALLSGPLATLRLWERRRDRGGLQRLDDHMLRDIGLDRSRADQMASGPSWRA